MNPKITLFDLLGVAKAATPHQAAAELWPILLIHSKAGSVGDDNAVALMQYLQSALAFHAVRPSAAGDRIGLIAEIEISNSGQGGMGPTQALVFASMPDIEFHLRDTGPTTPARLFLNQSPTGNEAVIEALPVEIRVPSDLLGSLDDFGTEFGSASGQLQTTAFNSDRYDSLEVTLRDSGFSSIVVRIRVRMTEEGDFVIEPAVPISIGPCRFYLNLPCRGLHDLNFVPSPLLSGAHSEREQALEWARHPLRGLSFLEQKGLLTVRTVDLYGTEEWRERFPGALDRAELVLEDLALPMGNYLPLPVHGLAGLRRPLIATENPAHAFGFDAAPLEFKITENIRMLVDEFFVQSVGDDSQCAFFKLMFTFGSPAQTTLIEAIDVNDPTIQVNDASRFPETPDPPPIAQSDRGFIIVVDPHTAFEERIRVERSTGNAFAVLERGTESETFQGTFAQNHDVGATLTQRKWALTVDLTDEWTLLLGVRAPEGRPLLAVASSAIRFVGVKLGASIQRLFDKDPALGFMDKTAFLLDIEIGTRPEEPSVKNRKWRLANAAGEPVSTVLRDVGWLLGSLTFGAEGIALPEGFQLIVFGRFRLLIDDIAWVTETNGAQYVSISGGLFFRAASNSLTDSAGSAGSGAESATAQGNGLLIRLHRFRIRVAGDGPALLIDGVSVALRCDRFELAGYGMFSEFSRDGHQYCELGLGLQVKLKTPCLQLDLAAQLFHGNVSGPVDNFGYGLFSFRFGPIPLTGVTIKNVSGLVAWNMRPNLPPADGTEQKMRLFDWYLQNGDAAVSIPVSRNLNAGGWIAQDESFAVGIGLSLAPASGRALRFDAFVFFHRSPEEKGLLIALQAFALRNPEAIGYGAIEIDFEHGTVGALFGVKIGLATLLGRSDPVLNGLAISGSLYLGFETGFEPGSLRLRRVAIGQLDDQATWASLQFQAGQRIKLNFLVAVCLQLGDDPDEAQGFGVIATIRGEMNLGVLRLHAYATIGVLLQVWRSESEVNAFALWIDAAARVELFRILSVGLSLRAEYDHLGPDPIYRRYAFEIAVELPWWLPDLSFRCECVEESRQPELMAVVASPVVSAAALALGAQAQVDLPVSPLQGAVVDQHALFSFAQLQLLGDTPLATNAFDTLTPCSVDSVIAIDLGAAVDDKLSSGEITTPGAGTQQANDLSVTHELVALGIRRRPRFGTNAGEWTSLLAPADTQIVASGTQITANFSSTVSTLWDRDALRGGQLDPHRLLINAAIPYSFASANADADETLARAERRWPCCTPDRGAYRLHGIDFELVPFGVRADGVATFSASSSTLHWLLRHPPVVAERAAQPGSHAACVRLDRHTPAVFASIGFDEPAAVLDLHLFWPARASAGILIVESHDGLKLLEARSFDLSIASPPPPIRILAPGGMTSVLLRYQVDSKVRQASGNRVEIAQLHYQSVGEAIERKVRDGKCRAQENRTHGAGGRFAWLPNHDYEISLSTRIILQDVRTAARDTQSRQQVAFRTKGLPGLNAVPRVGDELEPYVESVYPAPALGVVYRAEPVVIAFDERFNILAPVARTPTPGDPLERAQILEWVLAIDRLGTTGAERVTRTTADWIDAHCGIVPPPSKRRPVVLDGSIMRGVEREATTRDPARQRFETMRMRPDGCAASGPVAHRSQVLLHVPVDPGVAANSQQHWEPGARYRASVRLKDGPLTERGPFADADHSAFSAAREGAGVAPAWTVSAGRMRVSNPPAAETRCYAVFGDNNWNHLRMLARIDPQGSVAGLAVAVASTTGVVRATLALVDEGQRTLKIIDRLAGTDIERASIALPDDAVGPFDLELIAYDDLLRATVAGVSIEAARGAQREGRVALIATSSACFERLTVEPVDAYRFEFQASRYARFEDHVGSFSGVIAALRTDAFGANVALATVPALLAASHAQIDSAMQPDAGPAARQQLFDHWVSSLALPLRRRIDGLELTRLVHGSGTQLLLLESPEPLQFTSEVKLEMRRESVETPPTTTPVPTFGKFEKLLQSLVFVGNTVSALLRDARLLQALGTLHWLARAVDGPAGVARQIYVVAIKTGAHGRTSLSGQLVANVGLPEFLGPLPKKMLTAVARLAAGQCAFFDTQGALLGTSGIGATPPPANGGPLSDAGVPLYILTDGAQTRALLIPAQANNAAAVMLEPAAYRLDFSIDRIRFRAQVADAISNYRASASLRIEW